MTLTEILQAALMQAKAIPTFDGPRGTRQWMVNNQRRWTIVYLRMALELLDAPDPGGNG
jgi:hypothetical protein